VYHQDLVGNSIQITDGKLKTQVLEDIEKAKRVQWVGTGIAWGS
jgi:hypothetical protein